MALRDFALMMVCCLMWALNTIVSKVVVTDMGIPPLFYAAARFTVLLALVFPWLRGAPRPWTLIALVGFLMGGGSFACVFIGLREASPSSASIVMQLGVPMTIGLSAVLLGERLTRRRLIGMVLALVGALVVMWDPQGVTISTGLLWVTAGALGGALGSVLIKRIPAGVTPMQVQAWVALASSVPLVLGTLLFETGQWQAAANAGWPFVAAVAFAALGASLLAHTIFYDLLRRYEANLISPLTLMGPVMTIGMGVVITNDAFGPRMAFGALAALGGVMIIGVDPNVFAAAAARLRSRR